MLSKQWHNEAYNAELARIKTIYMGYQKRILTSGAHSFDTLRTMIKDGVPTTVTTRLFNDSGKGCAFNDPTSVIYRTQKKRLYKEGDEKLKFSDRTFLGYSETERTDFPPGYERILLSSIVTYIEEYIDTLEGEIRV